METQEITIETSGEWRTRLLLMGGIIGALTGLGAAYLMIQRSEKENTPPRLTALEGVKLGLLVFGLLRQVSQLGDGKEK